jgi:hypothetical protein
MCVPGWRGCWLRYGGAWRGVVGEDGAAGMSDSKRVCVLCKYFGFDCAEPDWSDLTPGRGWSMECGIYVNGAGERVDPTPFSDWGREGLSLRWYLDGHEVTQEQLRTTLLTAETCPDFEEVKP